jgi:hypothetical protein
LPKNIRAIDMQKRPSHRNDSRVEIHVLLQKSVIRRKSEAIDWPHFGFAASEAWFSLLGSALLSAGLHSCVIATTKVRMQRAACTLVPMYGAFLAFIAFHRFHRFSSLSIAFIASHIFTIRPVLQDTASVLSQSHTKTQEQDPSVLTERRLPRLADKLEPLVPDGIQDTFSPWFDLGYGG